MNRLAIAILFVAVALSATWVGAADPSATSEQGPFVITSVPYGNSDYVAIRHHKKTGESWVMQRNSWKKVKETTAVPAGNYNVILTSSGQTDQKSWFGFRVDATSGAAWRIADQTWHAIDTVEE